MNKILLPCLVFENKELAREVSARIVQSILEAILEKAPGNCHLDTSLIVAEQGITYFPDEVRVSCKIRDFPGFLKDETCYSGLVTIENLENERKKQEIEAAYKRIVGEYSIVDGIAKPKELK